MNISALATQVKQAALQLGALTSEIKDQALAQIATELKENQARILAANELDLARSEKEKLAPPLLKRLKFDVKKLDGVIAGVESLIRLPDPVGETKLATQLDEGLELYRVTCPLGVIGVIFESRPDALVQIATLCLKSGNGVLLKGGTEALETNRVLTEIIVQATTKVGIPPNWVKLLESRADVAEMLRQDQLIDLVIPRGSNDFVRYIMDHSRIPVMGHADGICHCYVDAEADLEMALKIVIDSKTQYVAVCNALETLLVHQKIAGPFLKKLEEEMAKHEVVLLGCEQTRQIIEIRAATDADWETEYLDYKLSIKIVSDLDEALDHINTYGSGHTDTIVTNNRAQAGQFLSLVDSGNVFWNASTRFSDGFRYGFGAEVGISTSKLHARGPVGLEGLLSYKYQLIGQGQIVTDYVAQQKTFQHKPLSKEAPF